jgi:hypothetical protein
MTTKRHYVVALTKAPTGGDLMPEFFPRILGSKRDAELLVIEILRHGGDATVAVYDVLEPGAIRR